MRINGTADVGNDTLAQPRDEVETRGGKQSEDERDHKQQHEIAIDVLGIGCGEAEVDHLSNGDRQYQRGSRRNYENDQRERELDPIRADECPESGQRSDDRVGFVGGGAHAGWGCERDGARQTLNFTGTERRDAPCKARHIPRGTRRCLAAPRNDVAPASQA